MTCKYDFVFKMLRLYYLSEWIYIQKVTVLTPHDMYCNLYFFHELHSSVFLSAKGCGINWKECTVLDTEGHT